MNFPEVGCTEKLVEITNFWGMSVGSTLIPQKLNYKLLVLPWGSWNWMKRIW